MTENLETNLVLDQLILKNCEVGQIIYSHTGKKCKIEKMGDFFYLLEDEGGKFKNSSRIEKENLQDLLNEFYHPLFETLEKVEIYKKFKEIAYSSTEPERIRLKNEVAKYRKLICDINMFNNVENFNNLKDIPSIEDASDSLIKKKMDEEKKEEMKEEEEEREKQFLERELFLEKELKESHEKYERAKNTNENFALVLWALFAALLVAMYY